MKFFSITKKKFSIKYLEQINQSVWSTSVSGKVCTCSECNPIVINLSVSQVYHFLTSSNEWFAWVREDNRMVIANAAAAVSLRRALRCIIMLIAKRRDNFRVGIIGCLCMCLINHFFDAHVCWKIFKKLHGFIYVYGEIATNRNHVWFIGWVMPPHVIIFFATRPRQTKKGFAYEQRHRVEKTPINFFPRTVNFGG